MYCKSISNKYGHWTGLHGNTVSIWNNKMHMVPVGVIGGDKELDEGLSRLIP